MSRVPPPHWLLVLLVVALAGCVVPNPPPLPLSEGGTPSPWEVVFGRSGLPNVVALPGTQEADLPSSVSPYVDDQVPLEVALRYDAVSRPVVLRTTEGPTDCLILYHSGHGPQLDGRADLLVAAILQAGCDVALLEMPLYGRNPVPVTATVAGQQVDVLSHDGFAPLEDLDGRSSLDFYVVPVVAVVGWAQQHDYDHLGMVGFSGGGWATGLAAALDERIQRSASIAGSMPLGISTSRDYEQTTPRLFSTTSYEDLYVMATSGGRTHLHLLNYSDDCCFSGQDGSAWVPTVTERVAEETGGTYVFESDTTHDHHEISDWGRERVLAEVVTPLAPGGGTTGLTVPPSSPVPLRAPPANPVGFTCSVSIDATGRVVGVTTSPAQDRLTVNVAIDRRYVATGATGPDGRAEIRLATPARRGATVTADFAAGVRCRVVVP